MTTQVYDPATKQTAPTTAIVPAQPRPVELVRLSMDTVQGFEALQRAARLLCASSLVPERYRGDAGLPNAVIALEMATRIGASPLMAMQHLYVVHGTPGWSAQFLIASVNSSGRFSALRYESKGAPGRDDYSIRAWAIERDTGEKLHGAWITWAMVKAEGWLGKNGSKWQTMPEQMGMYRAAAFWQRAYAPEIGMGLRTVEEIEDTSPVIDVTPAPHVEVVPAPEGEQAPEPTPEPEPAPRKGAAAVKAAMRKQAEPDRTLEPGEDPPAMGSREVPDENPQRQLRVEDHVEGRSYVVRGGRR